MLDVDGILRPWLDVVLDEVGPLDIVDIHTHVGQNDPDGFKQTPQELLGYLGRLGARAAVFPSAEPDGYGGPNDAVIAAAAGSAGVLQAFGRVDPNAGAGAEARRCLEAGAVGLKLHPRAEGFTMSHPGVRDTAAVAQEHGVPVIIHAGRGIPALGIDTVHLAEEFPRARFILAHAAISDLAWLWRELPGHPNIYIDTAWLLPADICAMLALCPPGQILWASDSPYGQPVPSAIQLLRCALQIGLSHDQIRCVMGEQSARLLAGEDPVDAGPAPGPPERALHPLVERLGVHLGNIVQRAFVGGDVAEPLGLARLACAVGEDGPHAEVMSATLALLDLFESNLAPPPPGRVFPLAGRFVVFAMYLARTPDVVLGPLPEQPAPTRDEAQDSGAA